MPKIFIENVPYEIKEGQNLLQACLSLGFDIPYFCWHPVLNSVGSCRQCAVKAFKDEHDTRGRIVMSCMTAAEDGTRISIDDPEVKRFRAAVIQWLMLNHPHDCPVCDEGGECHLQDMTVMTGHVYRKTRFKKRTFQNQDMGPFIHHEMNRCIQCYRCVRFYRDFAGGKDLEVFGVHDRLYFGRFRDGPLENYFSGNLVEICPTGVFTDGTLRRHYTRKWDLQTAPSVCIHCGLGCNTIPGERYGTIRRILNRYNKEVNGYFLCDRGRFGYEFINGDRRVRQILWRSGEDTPQEQVSRDRAMDLAATIFEQSSRVVGIGSPRASLESNYALKQLVGSANFSIGVSAKDQDLLVRAYEILRNGPARSASLEDVTQADAVLILGEDVANTGPMMALYLRQASRNHFLEEADDLEIARWNARQVQHVIRERKGPFFVASPYGTKLDCLATETFRGAPQDIARFGFTVAHALDEPAPAPEDMDHDSRCLAESVASSLRNTKRPLIVSGVTGGKRSVLEAAANIARALVTRGIDCQLAFLVPECNSAGISLMGGMPIEDAVSAIRNGEADTLIVLENDLYRRLGAAEVDRCLDSVKHLIVVDHVKHRTSDRADLILPAGTFAESDGTLINNEGRAQLFYQVFPGDGENRSSWQWIRDLMARLGRPEGDSWNHWDDIFAAMTHDLEPLSRLSNFKLPETYKLHGQKIPRQPHRYSGRTAMHANVTVHEEPPPQDPDSALSFSMEGRLDIEDAPLTPRYWSPSWNSVQALNKFQDEIRGNTKGNGFGQRIIEPKVDVGQAYFAEYPEPFDPNVNEWLVVPAYHIFGSEELSSLGPSVAHRSPVVTVGLNPADAERRGLGEGDKAVLDIEGLAYSLTVRLMPDLAPGLAAIPPYLESLGLLPSDAWIRVRRDDERQ